MIVPDIHLDPVREERRNIVTTMAAKRCYWTVVEWLSMAASAQTRLAQFWTLDEAEQHFGTSLRSMRLSGQSSAAADTIRAAYVVARFFNRERHLLR